jgi:hypothetical protein
MHVAALRAEDTHTREAIAAVEAARAIAVLTIEASTREAAVAHDRGVEDKDALAESEALERVSRAEVENSAVLTSAHDDAKGIAKKIALLESELVEERQARKMSERDTGSVSRCSPFYRLGAWSYASPPSALLGPDAYPRECDLQPFPQLVTLH